MNIRIFVKLLLITLSVTVLTWLAACSTPATQPATAEPSVQVGVSWAYGANNMAELISQSDVIVVGKVGKVVSEESRDELTSSRYPILFGFTYFSFDVQSVIKGKLASSVTVHQTGMTGRMELDNDPLMAPGEQYVLFLMEKEDEPGIYIVFGGPTGRYRIVSEQIYSMSRVSSTIPAEPSSLEANGVPLDEFVDSVRAEVARQAG